jgi:hypothetical protein
MNNSYPSQIVFNPYAGINPRHLSSLALCREGNRLSGCNNFTPNAKINAYSSSVFHGQSGPGVRSIPMAAYHPQPAPTRQPLIPGVPSPHQQLQLISLLGGQCGGDAPGKPRASCISGLQCRYDNSTPGGPGICAHPGPLPEPRQVHIVSQEGDQCGADDGAGAVCADGLQCNYYSSLPGGLGECTRPGVWPVRRPQRVLPGVPSPRQQLRLISLTGGQCGGVVAPGMPAPAVCATGLQCRYDNSMPGGPGICAHPGPQPEPRQVHIVSQEGDECGGDDGAGAVCADGLRCNYPRMGEPGVCTR